MKWQSIVTLVVLIPILALFLGVGLLFWSIGESWEASTTSALVTGLITVCGAGAVVFCLLLAFIVGVPLAIRLFGESGRAARQWHVPAQPTQYPTLPASYNWQQTPPLPSPKAVTGGVVNLGESKYETWENSGAIDGEWAYREGE